MAFKSALWGIAGYLAGSVPFGLIFSNLFSLGNLRSIGSGNIGATNVLRTGNKIAAILTLLSDASKGFLIVWLSQKCGQDLLVNYGVGLASIIGHVWPVWVSFKGGKGVATTLGVYFAWNPILGSIVLTFWLVVAKVSRVSSLSALIAIGSSPFVSCLMWLIGLADVSLIVFNGLIVVLIIYTHRENLKRIIRGREEKITL